MLEMMYNRKLKNFQIEGVAKDQETILRIRRELEQTIEDDMRTRGYVPSIDITPEVHWTYIPEDEHFKYAVIMYGAFVGKTKAKKILGLLGPYPIMMEPYNGD